MKNEIISEIKETLKNEKKSKNNDTLESLKTNISYLNSNLKENINKLTVIKNDISLTKDAINIIEKKRREKKDKNKDKDNIKKNSINNFKDLFNVNNIPLKNINKKYKCLNCNNCYISDECTNEGQEYDGHFLMLVEFPKKK